MGRDDGRVDIFRPQARAEGVDYVLQSSTGSRQLSPAQTNLTGARGLSANNRLLLQQLGGIGEPAPLTPPVSPRAFLE